MLQGIAERRTHDYKGNGKNLLFAALDVATGSVGGKCYRRQRSREFVDFLKMIDRNVPDGLDIHIVIDNYATLKTAAVKAWLARRPHWRYPRSRPAHLSLSRTKLMQETWDSGGYPEYPFGHGVSFARVVVDARHGGEHADETIFLMPP